MTTSAADEVIAELQVLTEEQVAAITGLGRNTLKAMRRKGIGPRVTVLSTGRIGYRARDVQAWLDERAEVREVDVESFELPSAQDRAEVGLEALAAVEAIRHRDFDTLNEILFGSQHPANGTASSRW